MTTRTDEHQDAGGASARVDDVTEERLRKLERYELLEECKVEITKWAKSKAWVLTILGFIGFGSLTVQIMKETFERKVDAKLVEMNSAVADTKAVTKLTNIALDEANRKLAALDHALQVTASNTAELGKKLPELREEIEVIALRTREARSAGQLIAAVPATNAEMPVSEASTCDELIGWLFGSASRDRAARCAVALTDAELADIAKEYGLEVPVIQALVEVEGGASGFLADRRPKLLFERTVFHRLTEGRYSSTAQDISSPAPGGYGASGAAQYQRLAKAYELDANAALQSASWGRMGVLGLQYRPAGFADVREFVRAMSQSEARQIRAAMSIMKESGLLESLRSRNWVEFSRKYNGPTSVKSGYSKRLELAYARYSDPKQSVTK